MKIWLKHTFKSTWMAAIGSAATQVTSYRLIIYFKLIGWFFTLHPADLSRAIVVHHVITLTNIGASSEL